MFEHLSINVAVKYKKLIIILKTFLYYLFKGIMEVDNSDRKPKTIITNKTRCEIFFLSSFQD